MRPVGAFAGARLPMVGSLLGCQPLGLVARQDLVVFEDGGPFLELGGSNLGVGWPRLSNALSVSGRCAVGASSAVSSLRHLLALMALSAQTPEPQKGPLQLWGGQCWKAAIPLSTFSRRFSSARAKESGHFAGVDGSEKC